MKRINYVKMAVTTLVAAVFLISCTEKTPEQASVPEQATLTGEAENVCPSITVTLTAEAPGAVSYNWYKNNLKLDNVTSATYAATSSGTYQVAGVNTGGEGEKSGGKVVVIHLSCPPAAPVISGATQNVCPSAVVLLTATAAETESYVWYRGEQVIAGATGSNYNASVAGTYYAVAVNYAGSSAKSEGKKVAINVCPPAAPVISGATSCVCPAVSVPLQATCPGATSFQWYRYTEKISGATASTYLVTNTAGYYVAGVNATGEGAKNAHAHTVYIELCAANFSFANLFGTYNATGVPSILKEKGPASWTATIEQSIPDTEYKIAPFADFAIGGQAQPFYLRTATTGNFVEFAVDMQRSLGTDTYDGNTYNAFFVAGFTSNGGLYTFTDQYYPVFWDNTQNILDFSGVITYEGTDYEIIAGIIARSDNTDAKFALFSEFYKNCQYRRTGALGAPSFTGERVETGLPRYNAGVKTGAPVKVTEIPFDRTKFRRK